MDFENWSSGTKGTPLYVCLNKPGASLVEGPGAKSGYHSRIAATTEAAAAGPGQRVSKSRTTSLNFLCFLFRSM
jgi:hypothetical protein